MLCLKKIYRDELLQLALLLSLLRVNNDAYFETDLFANGGDYDLNNGTSWRSFGPTLLRSHYVHPKSLDSVLLNYEQDLFADLNSLGRYNIDNFRHPDVTAYLLNIERQSAAAANVPQEAAPPLPELAAAPPEDPVNVTEVAVAETNAESPIDLRLELTQEDMDLIEVLYKQDVDLGFSIDLANSEKVEPPEIKKENDTSATPTTSVKSNDDIEKLKTLEAINKENIKEIKQEPEEECDPWAGIHYTVDSETGEYVIKEELDDSSPEVDCDPECPLPLGDISLPLSDLFFDEALRLVAEGDALSEDEKPILAGHSAVANETAALKNSEEDLDLFDDMIQTSQFHHSHHRAFHQSRMQPFVRTVSMEQRWQDLAHLLIPAPSDGGVMPHPFSHHHPLHNYSHPHSHSMGYGPETARGVLLHNATLNPPMGDINSSVPYSNIGGTNLGNAVATSMNLTNSSEPMGEQNSAPHYKLEPNHEMMFYQNSTSELNQTDSILSSILNDEDLQLMDMAMNEGMYTMRMLDSNNTISSMPSGAAATAAATSGMSRMELERIDTSSDSAVSSMGSERVPSLSDGEWCDGGSDSGHTTGDHYVTDYQTKYRPYDYSYGARHHGLAPDTTRLPVAQKKHQMYGKRSYFQEQGATPMQSHHAHTPIKYEYPNPAASGYSPAHPEGAVGPKPSEMKYSCSMDFSRQQHIGRSPMDHVQHNHTYHLPSENAGVMPRPISREKIHKSRKSEDEHLTRDEKRARALSIPITVDDVINLPMDEFNERLSKYDLTEAQLSLIRDIRRRGKNKVAAQNCRKRKLDQILSLADEVKEMKDRKQRLINEHDYHTNELKRIQDKYQQLYRHVFQNLRDPEGNQYSPYQYSLQISADGSILVVPRSNATITQDRKEPPHDHKNG